MTFIDTHSEEGAAADPLCHISETLPLSEFSVEGAEGLDHQCDQCDASLHLGGGSDSQADAVAIDRGV